MRHRVLNQARNEDTKQSVEEDLQYTTDGWERRTPTDAIYANTLSADGIWVHSRSVEI